MKEAPFDLYIHGLLKEAKIEADYQGSSKKEIQEALSTASKSHTGNAGAPDFTAVVRDFVLVIEDKADKNKLCLKDDEGKISLEVSATENYALNGALFYAKKILEGSSFTKIFAFGCAGDLKHHVLKPVFVSNDEIFELSEIETFENFSPENIESYYKKVILNEESPEEIENENIDRIAATLHNDLRNYGNLGAHECPLIVAAILLALREQKQGFKLEQLTGDEVETDGEKLFKALEANLRRSNVSDQVKKERILNQFTFIKDRPILNRVHSSLAKTPLKYFAEFIKRHVYSKLNIESSSEDYIGRFYMEFIRYTGGNAQSLGVVITPKHITELFCDLVDLKPDDVIFDPCCGTGGFLIAGMHRMLSKAKNESEKSQIKKERIWGIELRDDMFSMATTSMILHGDGQSNLICDDFFSFNPSDTQLNGITVGFMNPPYSQARNKETADLSELAFIENLLNSVLKGGRVAVIVPISTMTGKTNDDKFRKAEILKHHTLEGVISLNKNTFYGVGTVPCIAVFTAGEPHQPEKISKFINFEDDGWELQKHRGLVETERAKDRKQYLLDCWRGRVEDCPSKFMIETHAEASDEWLHSFYYFNDEIPAEEDFRNSVADYLTFEFNMISHGRGYLFGEEQDEKKNSLIANKQWGLFYVSDVAEIASGIGIYDAERIEGKKPYIGASARNNGVIHFVSNVNSSMESGCVSVNSNGSIGYAFYHPYQALYSSDCKKLRVKDKNRYISLFIATQITQQKEKYSYGYKLKEERLKRQIIQLPIDSSGQPDYKFMEDFMRDIERDILKNYFEFISPRLKQKTKKVNFEGHEWKEFRLGEIFSEFKRGKRLKIADHVHGKIPYVSSSGINNGVDAFIGNNGGVRKFKNCLTIANSGSVGKTFFHDYQFIASDHVTMMKSGNMNKYSYLFISVLMQRLQEKYSFNREINDKRIKHEVILLPVDEIGQPDYKFMEDYIKNLEHEILKEFISLKSAD